MKRIKLLPLASCPPPGVLYTYVMQAENGYFKIGVSRDIRNRLASLNTASPFAVRLVAWFLGDCEAEFHEEYKKLRVNGEWFKNHSRLANSLNERNPAFVRMRRAEAKWAETIRTVMVCGGKVGVLPDKAKRLFLSWAEDKQKKVLRLIRKGIRARWQNVIQIERKILAEFEVMQ